jgi:hypothetical protein
MYGKTARLIILLFALSSLTMAQKNEVSLSAGALAKSDQQTFTCQIGSPTCFGPFNTSTSTSVALEAGYVRQVFTFRIASVGAEFPLVGVPHQDITTTFNGFLTTATQSSVFFTPSARIKFLPSGAISPFLSLGGGWAHYDATDSVTRGALQFGGGVDFNTPLPHLGIRAEVRDFWARGIVENSNFLRVTPERQHNVFGGAGIVIRF